MLATLLLPTESGLHLEALVVDDHSITVALRLAAPTAGCPGCGATSPRVHSRYTRTLTDVPCATRRVRWRLRVRRFFCSTSTCAFRTFTEQLPPQVLPYARRTVRATAQLHLISTATGGEAGARLSTRLGLPRSPDTLLRIERQAPVPPAVTPRLLGVDDWAQRRGHTYGTILVDLATHRPIDLLPDRTAATFAAWLAAHPGVTVISRDRAGAYADGARQGAPQAQQVADRWHLLKNLGETLERVLLPFYAAQPLVYLHTPAPLPGSPPTPAVVEERPASIPDPLPPLPAAPLHPVESNVGTARPPSASQQRRLARYEAVQQLLQRGVSISAIARQLGVDRKTVRRWARLPDAPRAQRRRARRCALDPYKSYLAERWASGCHNAARLWREIQAQGYRGACSNVRQYLHAWRAAERAGRRGPSGEGQNGERPLSLRQVVRLMQRPAEELRANEQQVVTEVGQWDGAVAEAYRLAQAFGRMVRERRADELEGWLAQAAASERGEWQRFAEGVRRDYSAVAAALRWEISNGPVEGHVHRLKLIKRRGYGRAKFDLLRQRVLAPP